MKKKMNNKRGFTLIEIIVTISMIMILMGIVIIGVPEMQKKGKDSIRIQDLDRVANALDSYYNKKGCYPYGTDPTCGSGRDWTEMSQTLISEGFLGEVLEDPINQGDFVYSYCVDSVDSQGTMYALMEKLETRNQALNGDYDKDWPERCAPLPCADNRCCKCRNFGGSCNPNPPAADPQTDLEDSSPYTYCIRNP